MNRLPLTVVAGYLGAGKTTLINGLLSRAAGRRIMVMVNDFGAVNIDAALIESAGDDMIALTNGCVCCTMGADLFMAMGRALDRRPRPDHLVIEASGVADPAKIAAAARAEPEMRHGGVVTVVDALNHAANAADPLIGPQVRGQVAGADALVVAKGGRDEVLEGLLARDSAAPILYAADHPDLAALLFDSPGEAAPAGPGHAAYSHWSWEGARAMSRPALKAALEVAPKGAYRLKGFVADAEGDGWWEAHRVGAQVDIRACAPRDRAAMVAIGPASAFDRAEAETWWENAHDL